MWLLCQYLEIGQGPQRGSSMNVLRHGSQITLLGVRKDPHHPAFKPVGGPIGIAVVKLH